MKKMFNNAGLLFMSIVFSMALVFSACEKDDENTNEVRYENIAITGAQEVPPVTTSASGTFNGTYNKTTKVLTYSITHNVAAASAAHFHEAPKDSSGAVVLPIAAPLDNITNRTTPMLTAAQESDLLRGRLYVNIHSPSFPAGEIRGQIPAR